MKDVQQPPTGRGRFSGTGNGNPSGLGRIAEKFFLRASRKSGVDTSFSGEGQRRTSMTSKQSRRDPEILDLDEAAELLRCCKRTVSRLIADGELAATRVRRGVRIRRRELERYLDR